MRLLRSSKIRRYRPPAPPPLYHFVCDYSSSSSHSMLMSSIHHNHHHYGRRYNNLGSSWELLRHPPTDCLSFYRRFSAEAGASETDEPLFPVEAGDPEEPFIAVQAVIALLDYGHDVTGFPWWIVISLSTLAIRLALFPLNVVQLKKMRRLGMLLPRLPRPFPPPQSRRSFRDQISIFLKEKKAARCPSLFWFVSSFAFQVPFFLLWMASIRRMSLDHYPGFDTGGTLWFQNLTEYSHGPLGLIFPFCIAGLHFLNIQFSFAKLSRQGAPGSLGSLAKTYKSFLLILALPILIGAFSVPHGSLVYWLTNSTLTLTQHSCLRHPTFLKYLGLPKMDTSVEALPVKKSGSAGVADVVIMTKEGEIPAQNLSPVELVNYSIKILSGGRKDAAIRLLRLAIEKDPEFVRALLIMGQTLVQNKQLSEAAECLESAISKLLVAGYHPTAVEEVDLLILSSQWAGIANVKQGKMDQGLVHLERIAQLKEPEDSKIKAHYYDCLLVLSSTLANVGREAEALKYLQMAAAYNPAYSVFIEQLQNESKEASNSNK